MKDKIRQMGVKTDASKSQAFDEFFDKYDERRHHHDEEPTEEDLQLDEEFQIITGHRKSINRFEQFTKEEIKAIKTQIKEGRLNYEAPTEEDVQREVIRTFPINDRY